MDINLGLIIMNGYKMYIFFYILKDYRTGN